MKKEMKKEVQSLSALEEFSKEGSKSYELLKKVSGGGSRNVNNIGFEFKSLNQKRYGTN